MKILIIDDHQIFSESLGLLLSTRLERCQTTLVNTVTDANKTLSKQAFDLCICDLYLPQVDGSSLLKKLQNDYPNLPTLVLSSSEKAREIAEVVSAGAKGFLNKSANSEEVITAVNSVAEGNSYFSTQTRQMLKETAKKPKIHITRRQKEALGYLAEGLSNMDIAERMFISELTVKTHVRDLMLAINANNRNKCVFIAKKRGLIN